MIRVVRTSATTPGNVGTGFTEVQGVAKPLSDVFTSPLTGDVECLVFHHTVHKITSETVRDHVGREFDLIYDERNSVPFVVDSDHGSAVVYPEDATLLLDTDIVENPSGRKVQVRRLHPGDEVYVAGKAIPAYDADVDIDGHDALVLPDRHFHIRLSRNSDSERLSSRLCSINIHVLLSGSIIQDSDSIMSGSLLRRLLVIGHLLLGLGEVSVSLRSLFNKSFLLSDTGETGAQTRLVKSTLVTTGLGLCWVVFWSWAAIVVVS